MDSEELNFINLINLDELKNLFDEISIATGLSIGIVDIKTNELLFRVGCQDLCGTFHPGSNLSKKDCITNLNALQQRAALSGKIEYQKSANGLVDCCIPIIIQGRHLANLLTGKTSFTPLDIQRFKLQAQKHNYDEQSFLDSLGQIPIISEEKFTAALRCLEKMILFSVKVGISNLNNLKSTKLKEQQLQTILYVAPAVIGLIVDRKIKWINNRMSEMVGYSAGEVEGQSARLLYSSDKEFERVGQEKYAQISKHGIGTIDTQWLTKTGVEISIELSSRPIDQKDLSLGVIFTAVDITQRKQIETSIIRAKDEWERTFDSMVDIVTILNSNFEIVRANKAAHSFFASDYGELNDKKCHEIFQGIQQPCSGCPLLDTLNDLHTNTGVMTHSGLGKIFRVTSSALKDTGGKANLLVHVARDITEQTQLQNETQRTQRLASLGELAAGVAHEINNPNGSIIYNSEIVRDVFKDLSRYVQKITPENENPKFAGLNLSEVIDEIPVLLNDTYDAAQRIKLIVTDLRDFSRYDDSVDIESVSLNDVVKSSCRLAGNSINKATKHFSLDLEEPLPPINGVSSRLEQVVLNLLLNACQALPTPEKKLSVSTKYDVNLGEVWLMVADEGLGISAKMLPSITDPFVTTKRENGGTGLGLSVSSRIVKEHHGQLFFESTLGKGTQVTLKLSAIGGLKNEC